MKSLKKVLALVLALVMVLTLSVTAFAEEEQTYDITIDGAVSTHTYVAYQVFSGKLTIEEGNTPTEDKKVLSDIEWGEGIDSDKFLAALQAEAGFKKALCRMVLVRLPRPIS